jgi:hypothetical protein
MKKNIVWLASYPKSGNTWFRIFLSNLRSEKAVPIDINEIQTNGIFSSNSIFEKATGIHPSDLSPNEADLIRPDAFRYYSSRFDDLFFIKAHDAYTYLPNNQPLFPSDVSFGAIYFIRNPLDVAVSWAFHNGRTTENAEKTINSNIKVASKRTNCPNQLEQNLLSWKEHVNSWMNNKEIPVLILRYEDMKENTLATFKKAVQFLKWDYSDADIQKAIELSSFKNLKNQELEKGFNERQPKQKIFFRKGQIGDWKNYLTEQQAQDIITFNHDVMKEFAYL